MSGAGFTSYMIQSSKSNLSLKKNIRKKYGRELRATIHTNTIKRENVEEKSKISPDRLKEIKSEINKLRQKQERKELLIHIIFGISILIFTIILGLYLNNY